MKKRSKYEGRLLKKMIKCGVARKKFSKLSGLCINTLSNIDRGHTLPHQSSLAKIEHAFNKLAKRGFNA